MVKVVEVWKSGLRGKRSSFSQEEFHTVYKTVDKTKVVPILDVRPQRIA
jgi:hypothetical protein